MMNLNPKWIIVCAALALVQPLAEAQDQGIGDMMFTAGTVATGAVGDEWGWVQWMATDSSLLKDRAMDLYMKDGHMPSTNLFSLKGVARQVTDPRTISLLLSRGEALGDDLSMLEMSVDSLYAGAEPVGSLSLAEKLAALISGSQDDPELYRNLVLMGRSHSSVAMTIGHGFFARIPSSGFSTFEIRDHDTNEVIGRVVLEGGVPIVLPAPGPIVLVPETSPKGNLNIRLRWDIPDTLKRASLLQFGYNLYRMDQDFAGGLGFDTTPPTATEIGGLVSNNTEVVQVNRMPILVDENAPWFAVDDNEGLSGGTPFEDGTNYYYFVSALDLLGRDGDLSDGFQTFPCDRFAPSVPYDVRTRTISGYSSGTNTQWVEVSWAHNTNDADTAGYYVYRHTSMADMQSNAVSDVANRIAGPISVTNAVRMYYEDHSLTSNDWSRTYWYTVRAEDDASCGSNLSGNSAPAYGLLRDWEGPPLATGVVVTIQGEIPETTYHSTIPLGSPDPENIRIICQLKNPGLPIAWAQFGWHGGVYGGAGSETNIYTSSKFYFSEGIDKVGKDALINTPPGQNESWFTVYCRVGSYGGAVSEWAHFSDVRSDTVKKYTFKCDIRFDAILIPGGATGPRVGPHTWGPGPTNINPVLSIPAVVGAETVRVYRRVDNGPRTLIHQGEMDEIWGAVITDYTGGSVNGGSICYYYQLFDVHGNAGPMVKIVCIPIAPRVDLPTPFLESIDSTGTAVLSPGLGLEWFCTTPGVERFEVAVALDKNGPPSTFGTPGYALDGLANDLDVVVEGVTNTLDFGFYRTGRVGTTFGVAGSPLFSLNSLVSLNRNYTVMVRAIGVAGTLGPWSNVESFRWNTVPTLGPEVPWPARPMPTIQSTKFHADMEAVFIDGRYVYSNGIDHVGIRIGEIPSNNNNYVNEIDRFELNLYYVGNPMDYLYANAVMTNQTVFPCVLYRYQLTNDLYQAVSGDVAQVSPLMEDIAYAVNGIVTTMYDPFIGINKKENEDPSWGIYLIDTQPVVRGARYQYLLMRFDQQTKELDRVISAGTVTIP
jgi:hypothetical protein